MYKKKNSLRSKIESAPYNPEHTLWPGKYSRNHHKWLKCSKKINIFVSMCHYSWPHCQVCSASWAKFFTKVIFCNTTYIYFR